MLSEVTKMQLKQELRFLKILIEKCEKEGITNDQDYLDFEDELNKLSTKDHNNLNANKK
jgi:hypothetical protein